MTEAENANAGGASKGSGCGCASKATAALPADTAKPGCCGGGNDHADHGHGDHHSDGNATVRDPVCGMNVDPATSQHRFGYRSETFHFCSADCRTKFAADPQKYLDHSKPKAAVPEGTIYTCPMHPQIRKVGPGSCPICGMALEPEVASLDAPPNPELADMTRRFWIGLVLSVPPVVLEMGGHLSAGTA
jgi:Cu+-exporting ATPase